LGRKFDFCNLFVHIQWPCSSSLTALLLEVFMTAQIPDILIHSGNKLALCNRLLDPYLNRLPKARRPDFVSTSTALWRGNIATWEIVGQRLYLTALEGVVRTETDYEDVDLASVFPWRQGPILATWVTDTLRCPEGRMRAYVHAGFASIYERDRMFNVVGGIVERESVVHNPPLPLVYEIDQDNKRFFLADGRDRSPDPFPSGSPVEPWRLWGDPNWGLDDEDEDEGYQIMASLDGLHHLESGE
jgi:hypothetical protein